MTKHEAIIRMLESDEKRHKDSLEASLKRLIQRAEIALRDCREGSVVDVSFLQHVPELAERAGLLQATATTLGLITTGGAPEDVS